MSLAPKLCPSPGSLCSLTEGTVLGPIPSDQPEQRVVALTVILPSHSKTCHCGDSDVTLSGGHRRMAGCRLFTLPLFPGYVYTEGSELAWSTP